MARVLRTSVLLVLSLFATTRAQAEASSLKDDEHWLLVSAAAPKTLPLGGRVALSVSARAAPGRKIFSAAPVVVEAKESSNRLTIMPTRLRRQHAADPKAESLRWDLWLTGKAVGVTAVDVVVRAWVCGQHICLPVAEPATAMIEIRKDGDS